MTETTQTEKLAVLLFTDIVGSVDIQRRLVTDRYTALLKKHDELFGVALISVNESRILQDTGEGI
ncbi:MAG TPA: hypothetical protein EYG57_12140 [Planctomycetes bacterium]|nr:hypothetical protein [Verrucomicrobiales bacterium]HIM30278.1 hypothetical protein [Planctomycetota bacterium]